MYICIYVYVYIYIIYQIAVGLPATVPHIDSIKVLELERVSDKDLERQRGFWG